MVGRVDANEEAACEDDDDDDEEDAADNDDDDDDAVEKECRCVGAAKARIGGVDSVDNAGDSTFFDSRRVPAGGDGNDGNDCGGPDPACRVHGAGTAVHPGRRLELGDESEADGNRVDGDCEDDDDARPPTTPITLPSDDDEKEDDGRATPSALETLIYVSAK
ncbi:hypothetical protein HDU89_006917 [Geranomyces variabilis]|nr:hypothetical protein HDU89_006917 [Geranomyces variabilis]